MKIKELFTFEEIQDVIEIGKIQNEKELVEKFVISPNLEFEICDLLDVLKEKRHKSANIIGNYGTGKSHLLAFLSLVLSKPTLVKFVQSEKIREKISNLNREFVIVKYELPAAQAQSLARIFFYRVRKQLAENYGIDIRDIKLEAEDKDTKELVEEILNKVKEKHPTKGLLVIFDEFSDFLKQKQQENRQYDLQFYRQLGECSNTMDFMFIASMQEYIFSDPRFVDQAASIAKTQQRYKDVRITNENVEEMIAQRVVGKSSNQILDLKKKFKDIEKLFSNLVAEEDKYVKLFPVHPYVIEVFSKLPYYEKRGIIQFLSKAIKGLLDKEFPAFVTYDLIYDDIDRVLTIKNNPDVRPVADAVDTLKTKIDLLDVKLRDTALKLVKALAILHLSRASTKNGATAQELANTLFIIPSNNILSPVDDIERIMEKLRAVSDGQFINRSKDGVYHLDLQKTQDYDVMIENKVKNMNDLKYVNEKFVENFLLNELDIFYDTDALSYWENSKKYVLDDSASWEDRKSFRKGKLVIDIGYKLNVEEEGDYVLTIMGHGAKEINFGIRNHIILKLKYSDSFVHSMKRLAAIEDFIKTKAYVAIMQNKKRSVIDLELKEALTKAIQEGKIVYHGKEFRIVEDLGIISGVTSEIVKQIKLHLLNEEFTNEYPKYPKLKSSVSAENIKGTVESVLKDIASKQGIAENLLNQSANILIPLGLYKSNKLDVSESEYADVILNKLEDATKNVSIQDIVKFFGAKPYGLQNELIYAVLAVLLRTGDIILSSKRGQIYSASDFNILFGSGLKAFDELAYVKKEEEMKVSLVRVLFDAIEEDASGLQTARERPEAYRRYIEKVDKIEKDIKNVVEDFEKLKQNSQLGLPVEEINSAIEEVKKVDFSRLKIKSIVEFKKLDYTPNRITQIKEGYQSLKRLTLFFNDFFEFIQNGLNYMKNVIELMQSDYFKKSDADKLTGIYTDSKSIVSSIKKLMKEDERKPIKGKIDEFKRKYKEIYYHTHNEFVGNGVDWKSLEEAESSGVIQKLNLLKNIRCINRIKFDDLLLRISSIKQTRCLDFNVDELETSITCPHCTFPKGNYEANINSVIAGLNSDFDDILNCWESQIFEELKHNKKKLENLDHEEKRVIQDILSFGFLPAIMTEKIVAAINTLLEDLEIKEIDLKELHKKLTEDTDVLKVDDFKSKVDNYIDELLKTENKDNVRLKVKKLKDE
jgi:hypothetical protein